MVMILKQTMAVQSVHRLDDHKVVSAATVRLHVEVGVEPELDALKHSQKTLSKRLLEKTMGENASKRLLKTKRLHKTCCSCQFKLCDYNLHKGLH